MNTELIEKIDRIQALLAIQSADTSSVVHLLQEYYAVLGHLFPTLPNPSERFLELRREFLHHSLESIEVSNPSLAARLQEGEFFIPLNC